MAVAQVPKPKRTYVDLIPFNPAYLVQPNGFVNLGATCYFNSLVQCILSCTSLFETLHEYRNRPSVKNNEIAQMLLDIFYSNKKKDPNIIHKSAELWHKIFQHAQRRQDLVRFTSGQQDVHEGMMLLLDMIDNIAPVKTLWEMRYMVSITCPDCGKEIVRTEETTNMCQIYSDEVNPSHPTQTAPVVKEDQASSANGDQPTPQTANGDRPTPTNGDKLIDTTANGDQPTPPNANGDHSTLGIQELAKKETESKEVTIKSFNNFIMVNSSVVEKFRCTNQECKSEKDKKKTHILQRVPEIVTVLLKKYNKKTLVKFPPTLVFRADNGKKFHYALVAQSEHSGSMSGGHYWSICLRCNESGDSLEAYNLNDISSSKTDMRPTENSYLIFYHFFKEE